MADYFVVDETRRLERYLVPGIWYLQVFKFSDCSSQAPNFHDLQDR